MKTNQMYTVAQVARKREVTTQTVYRWIIAGLETVEYKGIMYIPKKALDNFRARKIGRPAKVVKR